MPIFRPRTKTEILRDMIARVVARSGLVGMVRNSAVYHVLAAAAEEDAEQYFQMSRLRDLFSIDKATGSDLDARAAEIQPAILTRRSPIPASGDVEFSRPGTTGTVTIPIGTVVAGSDAQGRIQYRTTAAASITAGNTSSGSVAVVSLVPGARGNLAAGQIKKFITRVPGVTTVTNPTKFSNGRDRESDDNFRARLKSFIQAISRGTVNALEAYAANVILADGRRVLFSKVSEPYTPDGTVTLHIDDGTGTTDEYDETYVSTDDVLESSAAGGEVELLTTLKPIRDFISLTINGTAQTEGTDFTLNKAAGKFILTTALTAGDVVNARYRAYAGLVQMTQKVIDGDPSSSLSFPGVRAGGVLVYVRPAQAVFQTITGTISVLDGYDTATVADDAEEAIQDYINNLNIGEQVIVSEIVERVMRVRGMYNFRITDLSGTSPPVDQNILSTQVARISGGSISLV